MKIILESTIKDKYSRYALIETTYDDMTISEVIDELIIPVLNAYGYHPDTIQSRLREF